MKKKKYDTSVIMLYFLKQEHLLPKKFRKTIPYSTISSWRKTSYENYEGSQFRFLFDNNWDIISLKQENQKLKNKLYALAKAYVLLKPELQNFIKEEKNKKDFQIKVVQVIKLLKEQVGLERALKLLFTHRNQFYEWAVASRHKCTHSFSELCLRRYPRQLQRKEVEKIKYLLTAPKYEHWPIISIAGHALRKGSVVASRYSWYKYARILNISHKPIKKTIKQIGLIAQRPNEYLHIDTTYYNISETKRVCMTMVMDNFSKKILGFATGEHLSFTLIKSAITDALIPILHQAGTKESFLVSDGGKENNNHQIKEFISELSDYRLNKITALKDIQFSNSPIEAIHKIIKGRYLKHRRFDTLADLNAFLRNAIYDYNYKRPHYKHYPKTPAEVYFQPNLKVDVTSKISKAVATRVKKNLTTACSSCSIPFEKQLPSYSHSSTSPDLRSIVD